MKQRNPNNYFEEGTYYLESGVNPNNKNEISLKPGSMMSSTFDSADQY